MPTENKRKKSRVSFLKEPKKSEKPPNNENAIEQDTPSNKEESETGTVTQNREASRPNAFKEKEWRRAGSRTLFERLAYRLFADNLPVIPGYMELYEQSGIPLIYESYLSTGFLLAALLTIPTFSFSFILEQEALRLALFPSVLASSVLGCVVFSAIVFLWLVYPIQRRNNNKSKLENQLAFTFGIMGVLSAAGMNLDRLFEKIESSESNPVFADLARRFLRNVRFFGLDTEAALKEVSLHSPSESFGKMLESIAVAVRTTGSIHSLVMFESAKLFQEKTDKFKKVVNNLAVMAELYITLIVVGPIIFIIMLAIFGLLPSAGLPEPTLLINAIVFVGIPAVSVMFVLLLDSLVVKA